MTRTVVYDGFCHACNTRIFISQPQAKISARVGAPLADASSGRGVCPVCGKRVSWRPVAVAERKGDIVWPRS
jgi:hypothetical protein